MASTPRDVPEERSRIEIVEVGPRDGLQAETEVLAPDERARLIRDLAGAGARRIEVASFVHPKRVPQMAGAEEVVSAVADLTDVVKIGLVLNARGLERALATAVDEVNLVVPVADGYALSNQGRTSDELVTEMEGLIPVAKASGRTVSVTLSVAFGDPYDGPVPVDRPVSVATRMWDAGADEVAFADTIGAATPLDVVALIDQVESTVGARRIRFHFHDTRATGLVNWYAAWLAGASIFDTSLGGLGGSPFAPDAGGNVATEDLVHLCDHMGIATGMDLGRYLEVGADLAARLGHDLRSAVAKAGPFP